MYASNSGPIRLHGEQHEVDSFAACVHAAMAHWGRSVSYDCVAGLAGTAFSPALSKRAECLAWWTESGRADRIDFLGHALGFTVERSPDTTRDRRSTWAVFERHVREAIEEGGVVLCGSWPCWSVVTAWHDDPDQLALSPPHGLPMEVKASAATPMYVLKPCERSLTQCEALREAVKFGACVASGEYAPKGCTYGGRLYDAWLGRLDEQHLCPQCGADGWRCAERAASRARATQLSAAAFLKGARPILSALDGAKLAAEAEGAYARMAMKLSPYGAGSGLGRLLPDAAGRARYARDVAEVRKLHGVAAQRLSLLSRSL